MKRLFSLVLLNIFFISYIKSQDIDRQRIARECMQQVGIEPKEIEEAMATLIVPDTDLYKSFITCSYKKQGYQNNEGKILIDNVKKFLSTMYDPTELNILNKCGNANGSDHGEIAVNALKCILPKLQQLDKNNPPVEN